MGAHRSDGVKEILEACLIKAYSEAEAALTKAAIAAKAAIILAAVRRNP